jgi:hypothetical protein
MRPALRPRQLPFANGHAMFHLFHDSPLLVNDPAKHSQMPFWLDWLLIIPAKDDPPTHTRWRSCKTCRIARWPSTVEGQGRSQVVSRRVCFCYFFPSGLSGFPGRRSPTTQTTKTGQQRAHLRHTIFVKTKVEFRSEIARIQHGQTSHPFEPISAPRIAPQICST